MQEEWQVTWFTLRMAALATVVILPPGLLLAWAMAGRSWPGKSLVDTLITLPLVLPPVATGVILLKLFGRRGPVGSTLDTWFGMDVVFTWRAVVLAMAVMAFPLLVRAARVGFEQVDRDHLDAARIEGAGTWQVFWHVALPLARRGIVAGVVLAYTRALGEFGATILLAGNIPGRTTTLAVSIYQNIQLGQDATAFRLLGISLVLAFAAIWASSHALRLGGAESRRG